MNKFKTLVNLELSLDNLGNHDVETTEMEIEWEAELEIRPWGIKTISISVPDSQKLVALVNIWGDEQDEVKEMAFDIKDVVVSRSSGSDSLYPTHLELYKGQWTLVF